MAKSYKDVYDLWLDQSEKIVSSPKNWMSFLNTASWMYKYQFEDQILIYAQRPRARACAAYDVWNEKLHRWIKSGSKGIALLRDNGPYLRYVFDIADTRSPRNKELLLWSIQQSDHAEMIEMIENKYGIEHEDDLGNALIAMAEVVSADNCLYYAESLLKYRDGSGLEHLEIEEVKNIFTTLVTNTISYELLNRCELDTMIYLSADDFYGITNFNSLDAIGQLGVACHDIGVMAFQDISRKAREIMNRTFAEKQVIKQNDSKKNERNDQNERIDIQPSERLSVSESTGRKASTEQQIRKDAVEISEGESSWTPVRTAGEQRIEQSFTIGRPTGKRNDGNLDEAVYGERKDDDTQQGNESNGMGSIHEQSEDASRGNRIEGNHLQLDLDIEEKGGNDTELPPFDMDDLPQLLREDIKLKHSKKEIVDFFQSHNVNERIEYLKECYDETLVQTYRNPILHDFSYLGYKRIHDQLEIWHGNYLNKHTSSTISFSEIEYAISNLIEKDEYLISPDSRMSDLQRAYRMKVINRNVDKAIYSHVDELNYTASEVIAFFNTEKDEEARVAYVERLYPDERVEFVVDDIPLGYQKFEDHLFVYMGTYQEPIDSAEHPWRLVASMIDGLILSRYYAPSIQIPTQEEQKHAIYESLENFKNGIYFSQEEIDRVLTKGSGFEDGKYRIYEQMLKHESEKDNIYFLKHEYGTGGVEPAVGWIGEGNDGKGIHLWKGDVLAPDIKINIKWKQVNKRINELIAIDRYLSPLEKEYYPIFLQQQIEKELEYKRKQKEKELGIESNIEEVEVIEPLQEMDYQWKLGDRVYIGIQEYEVIEDGEQVVLQDKEFPLFTESYSRDEI